MKAIKKYSMLYLICMAGCAVQAEIVYSNDFNGKETGGTGIAGRHLEIKSGKLYAANDQDINSDYSFFVDLRSLALTKNPAVAGAKIIVTGCAPAAAERGWLGVGFSKERNSFTSNDTTPWVYLPTNGQLIWMNPKPTPFNRVVKSGKEFTLEITYNKTSDTMDIKYDDKAVLTDGKMNHAKLLSLDFLRIHFQYMQPAAFIKSVVVETIPANQ